ncbi:MAG: hypothetical protein Q9187_005464 [Circinaria calcarea]
MEQQSPENTAEQQDVETTVEQQGTASNTAEQAKLEFIQEVLNKRVEFEENGVKKKGEILWRVLATFVLEELKRLKEQDPVVDATYSSRVKENGSLQGKIERMQKSKKCQTLDSIREMRWDIAATRICLYFPCQLLQVKNFIEQNEHFEIIPYTPEDEDKDTEPRPTEYLPAKPFREREYIMRDPETRPYMERMGYYEADHYWIRLKKTHPKVSEKIPNYDDEAIEIQVRTVLMDAWAEIRHDLDYKHILGYPSGDELRVLDAIKGTIASCEIMQDHLFKLREQRIKRDCELFKFDEPNHFWQAIINALQPKHRLLLKEFGDKQPSINTIAIFFEYCNIRSPHDLKNKMAGFIKTQEQKQAITHVRESFSMMSLRSRSQYSSISRISGKSTPLLFRFIAIFLLTKMGIEDIQINLYTSNYILKSRLKNIRPAGTTVSLLSDEAPLEEELSLNRSCVVECATRWYEMLSNVLEILGDWLDDEEEDLYTETNNTKLDQIISIVARLCSYYRKPNGSVWNQRALWLCAVITFTQFENRDIRSLFNGDYGWSRDTKTIGNAHLEDYESEAWRKGEQLAAEIIGVEPTQLKHAILYRTLCQRSKEDNYEFHPFYILDVLDYLEDKDINVNWQDSCGISLLGAAAAFGTHEICEAMLARPEVNVNVAFPDGLSLIHIAVARENKIMVELLISNHNLDIEAIWRVDDKKLSKAPYWTQFVREWCSDFWCWDCDEGCWPDEKLSWTALEMAKHRMVSSGQRPEQRDIYNLLRKACRSKD